MTALKVAEPDELRPGERKLCELAGSRVVVFHEVSASGESQILAFDNHCPHRGGPIGAGRLEGGCLTCPWHGLQFELPGGGGRGHTGRLTPLAVERRDDGIYVQLASSEQAPRCGASYVVRYASVGHVGRFESCELELNRGDRVLLQTDRGQEFGEVLARQDAGVRTSRSQGQILRRTGHDEVLPRPERLDQLLQDVREFLAGRSAPVEPVDGELLADGATVILYHLSPSFEQLGRWAAELSQRHDYRFQFESLAEDAPPPALSPASSAGETGEDEMKGPYERLKHDLRRVWECPVCGRHERWSGNVTSALCPCQEKEPLLQQRWMKMLSEGGR